MRIVHRPHSHAALPAAASVLLFIALYLNGCSWHTTQDPASPYSRIPPGSVLNINRKIKIPPGSTRVFFQNGRVSPAFNHFEPNCNIEVNKIDQAAVQYVQAGAYRVSRVQQSLEEIVYQQTIKLATLGTKLAGVGGDGGDGSAMIYVGYHLWLESADPNVRRLSCRGAVADPPDAYPPSVEQIRRALGKVMTLELQP